MKYEAGKFDYILGAEGLSDEMLKNHFGLYEGYVKNTNKLSEILERAENTSPEYAELKRRFGWEWNGMRLHELYFENISKDKKEFDGETDLGKKISEIFGSFEKFQEDFKATGAMRGIGWVVLYRDKDKGDLSVSWIDEHDKGHLSGADPILVMDVFEHAHYIDYGKDRGAYIEAFWNSINWEVVIERFDKSAV